MNRQEKSLSTQSTLLIFNIFTYFYRIMQSIFPFRRSSFIFNFHYSFVPLIDN
jgi:hypothetical protein